MNKLPYGKQSISKADLIAVIKALKSPYLSQGPLIEKFEKRLADYVGAKYAVAVSSGTAALHTAYFSLGLHSGDEFITSPMTFAATANAGLYLGAKPVFVDIEENTGCIDINKITKTITKKTKLIVPIHYSGYPAELKTISSIARKYNLYIVEDACHALGSEYQGKRIGCCQYSDLTVFSFHPVKHITTGEGGAIVTNNKKFYERMLLFRTHGLTKNAKLFQNSNDGPWYHEMQVLGFNYRITDFQAALGLSQLKRLETFVRTRRKIAVIYDEAFKDNQFFDILKTNKDRKSAYHLYPILIKNKFKHLKKEIFQQMLNHKLGVQVHYLPAYRHPYYQSLGYKKNLCPQAEIFYQREISLPMYSDLTKNDINYVIKTLKFIFSKVIPFKIR